MPNTKTTPRTQTAALVCPKCKELCEDSSMYSYHIRVCMEEQVGCDECRMSFKTRKTNNQHVCRVHQVRETDADEDDWQQEDPGDLIEEPVAVPTPRQPLKLIDETTQGHI
ncbi:hypothetical protein DPMN_101966 [Dreissena polymorpha]|uniref:C2H2-type domain-containing protein n=1 Tax=Dreissena polymorpha TaxID=45954 RepID=A0A9D4LK04_DREPO|nr:hypothetical protein DPMN_101966 [Dreissena polymorpha]